jgi:hypothetical protein
MTPENSKCETVTPGQPTKLLLGSLRRPKKFLLKNSMFLP